VLIEIGENSFLESEGKETSNKL